MNEFETDLATALRSVVPAPPEDIDPMKIVDATRPGRLRTVAAPLGVALAVVCVALAVVIVGQVHQGGKQEAGATGRGFSTPAPTAVGQDGGLTTAQRALAIRIAKASARTSIPAAWNSTSPADGNEDSAWPPNVQEVSAIATTHASAAKYVATSGADPSQVIVIRLVGDFSWDTTGPVNHGPTVGNVATIVVDARSGRTTDAGLEQQQPPKSLPNATVLYQR